MKSSKANNMNLKHYFDMSRFWLLLRLELFRSRKGILMTFVLTFGVLFFFDMLLSGFVERNKLLHEHQEGYAFTLIVGGFVLSSLAYRDLGDSLKAFNYLTLPVSTLEKFLSMWLLTSIGWIVFYTLIYTVYTWIANPIGQLVFNDMIFLPFEPLGEFSVTVMKYYFVTQGIFLVGAAHFKGYVFPKTLFTIILFMTACGTIIYWSLRDIFLSEHECSGTQCEFVDELGEHTIWQIIKWMFWWILAPVCWVTTYLGLKEQEV